MNQGKIVLGLPRLARAIDTVLSDQAGQPVDYVLLLPSIKINNKNTMASNMSTAKKIDALRTAIKQLEREQKKPQASHGD